MDIREIAKKVREENTSIEELKSLYDLTTKKLNQIGDLRSIKYSKNRRIEASRMKNSLWSIRCSIRYRLNNNKN